MGEIDRITEHLARMQDIDEPVVVEELYGACAHHVDELRRLIPLLRDHRPGGEELDLHPVE